MPLIRFGRGNANGIFSHIKKFGSRVKKFLLISFSFNFLLTGGLPMSYGHRQNQTMNPMVAHDYDSMVWCVSAAKRIPIWQNIFHILKDYEICIGIFLVYVLDIFLWYSLAFLDNLDIDIHHMAAIIMLTALNMPAPKYRTMRTMHRVFHANCLYASLLTYTMVISFYVVTFNSNMLHRQVNSWMDIELEWFQLVVDRSAFAVHGQVNFGGKI